MFYTTENMSNERSIKMLKELYHEYDKFKLDYNGEICDIKVNDIFDNMIKFQFIMNGKLSPENLCIDNDKIVKIRVMHDTITIYI